MMRLLLASMLLAFAVPADARTSFAVARLGQTVQVGDLRVTPVAVKEDSRCPQMVSCVWRGRLRITAAIAGQGRITLDNGVPVALRRGRLTLIDAVPLSQRGETIPPGAYRFRFRFDR
jgi:hypothetical protein